jgi:hypothetical protein
MVLWSRTLWQPRVKYRQSAKVGILMNFHALPPASRFGGWLKGSKFTDAPLTPHGEQRTQCSGMNASVCISLSFWCRSRTTEIMFLRPKADTFPARTVFAPSSPFHFISVIKDAEPASHPYWCCYGEIITSKEIFTSPGWPSSLATFSLSPRIHVFTFPGCIDSA